MGLPPLSSDTNQSVVDVLGQKVQSPGVRRPGCVEDEDDARRRVRAREEVEETSGCLPRVSDESASSSSVTSIEIEDVAGSKVSM